MVCIGSFGKGSIASCLLAPENAKRKALREALTRRWREIPEAARYPMASLRRALPPAEARSTEPLIEPQPTPRTRAALGS
jgi:hypothetical protein